MKERWELTWASTNKSKVMNMISCLMHQNCLKGMKSLLLYPLHLRRTGIGRNLRRTSVSKEGLKIRKSRNPRKETNLDRETSLKGIQDVDSNHPLSSITLNPSTTPLSKIESLLKRLEIQASRERSLGKVSVRKHATDGGNTLLQVENVRAETFHQRRARNCRARRRFHR